MGLLKGTFQSLKEIRIQLVNTKCHKLIIMWAHICIILHNLIIRIEGDNFDDQWRESLVRTDLEHERNAGNDIDEEEKPRDALEQAQQRLAMPRQRFRLQLMDNLFDSPFLTVECCL